MLNGRGALPWGRTFTVSVGRYGGFYWRHSEVATRLCLGWVAVSWFRFDLDDALHEAAAVMRRRHDQRVAAEAARV